MLKFHDKILYGMNIFWMKTVWQEANACTGWNIKQNAHKLLEYVWVQIVIVFLF
jgi:hypothetical protein